tara:strand:- start:140 stop:346 length:207 start_codon:yes stop_codon:yes gene_type:complete
MTYKILGMDYADNLEAVELHETDSVERANSWVVGYIRFGDLGYDSINVVAPNGFTKSEYSRDFGWTHY